MFLSIIIPIYNTQNYLKTCLNSIYKTDLDLNLFEVILINDGSTDNSLQICQEFENKCKNITLKTIKNQGQGIARNLGLRLAIGEYIWFIDSDDFIKENSLDYLYVKINKKNFELFIFRFCFVDETAKINNKKNLYFPKKKYLLEKNCEDILKIKTYFPVIKIINKNFLKKYNIKFGEGYIYEDLEFNIKISAKAKKIACLNKNLYFVRINQDSTTKTKLNTKIHATDFLKALKASIKNLTFRKKSSYFTLSYHFYFTALKYCVYRMPKKYIAEFLYKSFLEIRKLKTYNLDFFIICILVFNLFCITIIKIFKKIFKLV